MTLLRDSAPSSQRGRRRAAQAIRRALLVAAQAPDDTSLKDVLDRVLEPVAEVGAEVTLGVRLSRPERIVVFRTSPSRSMTVREVGARMFPDLIHEVVTSIDAPGVEGSFHLALSRYHEVDEATVRSLVEEAASLVALVARGHGHGHAEPQRAEKLQQLDKLATVGQTASQIAHEMNNPLTAIVAYTDFLSRRSGGFGEVERDRVVRIAEAAKRLQQYTRDLTEYSRPPSSRTPLDLREVVERALGFCVHVLRDLQIEVDQAFSDDVPLVRGSQSALVQVFVNLITNAAQAMEVCGGTRLALAIDREDERVVARVADQGCGIAPDDHHRVFESYFTTKPQGRGVGLGLTIVRQVVRDHGGEVWAEPNAPHGTVFFVALPIFSLA